MTTPLLTAAEARKIYRNANIDMYLRNVLQEVKTASEAGRCSVEPTGVLWTTHLEQSRATIIDRLRDLGYTTHFECLSSSIKTTISW